MYQQLHGEKPHPDIAMSLNNVGTAYESLGDYPTAKRYFAQGLNLSRQLDPELADSYVAIFRQRLSELEKRKKWRMSFFGLFMVVVAVLVQYLIARYRQ